MEPIIYYSDNPHLGIATVKTASGQTEYLRNCRKILGNYYIREKECFLVEGTYYRVSSGLIEKDWETGNWFLKKNPPHNIIHGLVSFDENGTPIFGHYTKNPYNNVSVSLRSGGMYDAINSEVLLSNGYGETFSTGIWQSLKDFTPSKLQRIENILDYTNKGYNIEDNAREFDQKKQLWEAFNPELTKDVRRYARMLGDTTFGVELECSHGYLPDNLQNQTGVVICRDGSLNDENGRPGPEFVTIPLRGAKGLQTLSNVAKELTKRTKLSLKCSLHIHLGNLPTTRTFLVSLFRLCYKIQDEIFLMFPYYKTNPEGIKSKNYNQKLPLLGIHAISSQATKEEFTEWVNDSYKKIGSWLGEGYQLDHMFNRKLHNHPVAQKWNRTKRYYWMNCMNAIWSSRNTIEFRPHTPTTNVQKIINWLFIINAIVKYSERNYSKILTVRSKNITLNDVLDYYAENFGKRGQFLSEYLKAYVAERKRLFLRDYEKGDYISQWEMDQDKNYLFTYGNVSYLF